ncbi:MAG: hypothetical protein ABSB29_00240 [Nitrososphaerales archaeon]|jgi:hypothetical protein
MKRLRFLALFLMASLALGCIPEQTGAASPSCPAPQVVSGSKTTISLFWITDTQYLSIRNPGLFMNTTQWIAKYYAACNGRMVVHTGDIIQGPLNESCTKAFQDSQWRVANQSMSVLLEANIPYTWDAGNHDVCSFGRSWFGWNYTAFNPSALQKASLNWSNARWVSSDNEGMDTAVSFSGAGNNFLLLNIQYNGTTELGWAKQLLSNPSYLNYRVIIATHDFINNTGGIDYTGFAPGLTCLMNGCNGTKAYPNVFLTLNGHFPYGNDSGYHTTTASGRHELFFDRQERDEQKGAATVAILTFDMENNKIYVNTFDLNNPPPGEDYTPLTSPSYQFTLGQSFNNFAVSAPAAISQSSNLTLTATAIGGVSPYAYQWFAMVPGNTTYSPIAGVNSSTYMFTPKITGDWQFRLNVTDSRGVVFSSWPITVMVKPSVHPIIGLPLFWNPEQLKSRLVLALTALSLFALSLLVLRKSQPQTLQNPADKMLNIWRRGRPSSKAQPNGSFIREPHKAESDRRQVPPLQREEGVRA